MKKIALMAIAAVALSNSLWATFQSHLTMMGLRHGFGDMESCQLPLRGFAQMCSKIGVRQCR